MTAVVDEILEKIEQLTLLEAADLVKKMEDKFGVSAAAPVMAMGAMPAAGAGPAEEEEEVDVSVILVSPGSQKIKVLKEIRAITGLALKEAKELVDNPPKPVKEGLKKEEAKELQAKLEELGATIEVK